MGKVLTLAMCLLAITHQAAQAQDNLPLSPKSTETAIKYSVYGTVIPMLAGGAIFLAASEDDVTMAFIGIEIGAMGAVVGPGLGHAYVHR